MRDITVAEDDDTPANEKARPFTPPFAKLTDMGMYRSAAIYFNEVRSLLRTIYQLRVKDGYVDFDQNTSPLVGPLLSQLAEMYRWATFAAELDPKSEAGNMSDQARMLRVINHQLCQDAKLSEYYAGVVKSIAPSLDVNQKDEGFKECLHWLLW